MNHFTRLIDLTSADEDYVAKLAASLAPCILRPRTETSLTLEEKHAYRLIRDLFAHKDAIFNELKRMSTLSHTTSVGAVTQRPRAISTDESNRKAHMEERNRALLEKATGSRSRATSPAPSPRGTSHRRDRSVGGSGTRFPIQTSPSATNERGHRQSLGPVLPKRTSLEVPGEESSPPSHHNHNQVQAQVQSPPDGATNGNGEVASAVRPDSDSFAEKRNSLGRSGARFVGGRRVTVTSSPPSASHGVTLVDAPMDD